MAEVPMTDIPGGAVLVGSFIDESIPMFAPAGDFDAPDTTPPVINNIVPAPSSVIDPATNTISFDVTDDKAFGRIIVTALYTSGLSEVIHDSLSFSPDYTGGSTRSNLSDGFTYSIVRTGGWLEDFTLYVLAIDAGGNIAEVTPAYTVPNGPGTGAADNTRPIVTNYIPSPNTPITENASITFDVTDDSNSFCSLMVTAYFPETGVWEVLHTGVEFSPQYKGGSGRATIPNGFRYVARRTSGWQKSPTIITFAVDAAGNESI